jgi:hypothetical protein
VLSFNIIDPLRERLTSQENVRMFPFELGSTDRTFDLHTQAHNNRPFRLQSHPVSTQRRCRQESGVVYSA